MPALASFARKGLSPMDKEAVGTSRIVIFGDDDKEANELERLIEDTWEIPVIKLRDSPEGISSFHEIHPDLVVMDHKEAAHVLQEIQQDVDADGFLPTLVLISDDDRDEKQKDVVAGATEFLSKPIDPAEALLRIHNLLSLHDAWRQLRGQPSATEESLRKRADSLREQIVRLHGREQVLVQQNRLHALGTMASGVAHDFNNVLGVIIAATEHLLRDHDQSDPQQRREFLKAILSAAEQGAQVVHRLREFHRPADETEIRQPVDLNGIIEQTVGMTRPKWSGTGRDLAVCMELAPIPPLNGDAAELREMLMNLAVNAIDAMPEGGTLSMQTRNLNGQVVLEVRDTGEGMTERVRRRCLEPFFTTKGEKGTGLGLAIVHGIADRHGATMELESEVGRGTVFRFRFPPPEIEGGAPPTASPALSGLLKIMVVDDEPIIGEVLAAMLGQDGHEVIIESDPHEAIQSVIADPVDLVITDKSMPLMDGDALAAAIKAAAPSVKVMMITGYGAQQSASSSVDCVVGKPVDLDGLRQAVAKTCGPRDT